MQFGSRINGRFVPIIATLDTLPITKSGEIYEVQIQTEGISDETAAIQQILTLEETVPDLKLLYVGTNSQTGIITLQIVDVGPGSISFSGLFMSLPTILLIIGIVIAAYFLWQIYTWNPLLILSIAILGFALVAITFASKVIPEPRQIRTESKSLTRESPKSALDYLESERKNIDQALVDVRGELSSMRGEMVSIEKKKVRDSGDVARFNELRQREREYERMQREALDSLRTIKEESIKVRTKLKK